MNVSLLRSPCVSSGMYNKSGLDGLRNMFISTAKACSNDMSSFSYKSLLSPSTVLRESKSTGTNSFWNFSLDTITVAKLFVSPAVCPTAPSIISAYSPDSISSLVMSRSVFWLRGKIKLPAPLTNDIAGGATKFLVMTSAISLILPELSVCTSLPFSTSLSNSLMFAPLSPINLVHFALPKPSNVFFTFSRASSLVPPSSMPSSHKPLASALYCASPTPAPVSLSATLRKLAALVFLS